jgi:RNA polymerase sigma-70 factor (ECF subfamily)
MGPQETRRPTPGQDEPPKIDWPAVLREHDRWLRTVIYARLGQPRAVEVVMQEVALAALKQNSPIRDPDKVAPWLYRLAVLQSLLYRRKQGRRRKLKRAYAEQVRPTEEDGRTGDPLDWLLADERRQLIRTALERLPKRDKEILLLKYIEDWSYRQLADHLGASTSAVEARLHRARQRLRRELVALEVVEVKT